MWRDLLVLDAMEEALRSRRRTALLLVLATEAGPRLSASTSHMHQAYGWPVVHQEGFPDLSPGELTFDLLVRRHNARARNSRVVFINQFGFDAETSGGALPDGVGFGDLRRGTDAEFGQSIYEPFGIAQIEPIGHGAVSIVSDACGCVGFLRQSERAVAEATGQTPPATFVVGDYAAADPDDADFAAPDAGAWIQQREAAVCAEVATAVDAALPGNDSQRQALLEAGHAMASHMSWERVVSEQLLPALSRKMA